MREPLKPFIRIFIFFATLGALAQHAWAGPPFLTDDPVPVDYRHFEFYEFQTLNNSNGTDSGQAPACEFNWGGLPGLQIHVLAGFTYFSPGPGLSSFGLGDCEAGFKYRFIDETPDLPMFSIFPAVEIPTGDASKSLGNGLAWYRLPLWIQKSWGPWTSYAGGGYALNAAAGARNYPFGGWLLQRDLNSTLTLGGELYAQGQDTDTDQGSLFVNLGGSLSFTPQFSLLFSGGHSIAGDDHTVAYLGLFWTWGPEEKSEP